MQDAQRAVTALYYEGSVVKLNMCNFLAVWAGRGELNTKQARSLHASSSEYKAKA